MTQKEGNPLPPNVGAAMHPTNKNYIMFTTFDGTNPEGVDTLDLPAYQEAIKKLVTVMEYEYFQSLVEAAEGDTSKAGRMMYLPQTIRKMDQLATGFTTMITQHCEDYGEETTAIIRFFEFDKNEKDHPYRPVDVQFAADGSLDQPKLDEEE